MIARRELGATLKRVLPMHRFDDTVLAVGEAITWGFLANVHRGRDRLAITVDVAEDHVRLEVDQARPRVHPSRPRPVSGEAPMPHVARIRAIARDWGFEAGPPSRIWFDVRR